jgi:gamma-glutamyl hydrolase
VPILINDSEEEIDTKLANINGVFFPGGDGWNLELAREVFSKTKQLNDQGVFMPIWGTCLGFENLIMITADRGQAAMEDLVAADTNIPLTYVADPATTRMYEGLGDDAWVLASKNYTYNWHSNGTSPTTFQEDQGLSAFWDVTAVSFTPNGTAFTASIEAKNYPFFATQYHTEKPS